MNLKLLLGLLFIVWRSTSAEEYTNHWRATEDVANVEFCSHDSFKKDSNCICNVDYTGNFCLNRKCRNFGFDGQLLQTKTDRCICPPGFLGRNCEPVSCVPGKYQVYSTSKNEKTISLLASFNTKLQETWETGDIGQLICSKEAYGRNFNYNYENAQLFTKNENATECYRKVETFLTPDPCLDDNNNPIPCFPLDINNLNSLVQNSPPNSIINVLVYNNTGFLANDPGLAYLSDIASATLGTFVLPSIKAVNEQYGIVSTLLDNWDQGFQLSNVYTNAMKTMPVDNTLDLFVAVQTEYGDDAIFNVNPMPTVVSKTDFWKLYKITKETFPPHLTITNQKDNTQILVYSSGGLTPYSAFTSDKTDDESMVVDAAYSISVNGTGYPLVVRFESGNAALDYDVGFRQLGSSNSITLGSSFSNRSYCQFNFQVDATCNTVGPSVVTIVTPDNARSVSFPVYCASYNYASRKYNNFVSEVMEIKHFESSQTFSRDMACGAEIDHETYGKRTFVIIAENSKNTTDSSKSSVDNVFRNKNSIFYQLTDLLNTDGYSGNRWYSNFVAVLNDGSTSTPQTSSDYGIFLTKVMDATSSSPIVDNFKPDAVSINNLLTSTIQSSTPYSDILFVVNYNVSVSDGDSTAIKAALEKQRSKLFVLFVQTNMQYGSDIYTYTNDLAISSGGVAIRLNSYDDLHVFFEQYFKRLVSSDIVAKAYSENMKAGIALNNVYLLNITYYLLITNENLAGDGPVTATVNVNNLNVTAVNTSFIGELQLFSVTPSTAGVYNIPIMFSTSGFAQFVSGAFTPVIYSSKPFGAGSAISVTYSDAANPAKPVYSGNITNTAICSSYSNYIWTTPFNWKCSISGGLYHVKIDRITEDGSISRTFPITCIGPNAGGCLNGGSLAAGGDCSCPLEYTGSKCETPRCLNGGTVTPADTCTCMIPFTGDFCETAYPACSNSPSQPDYRSDLSSLVIVADVNALSSGVLSSDIGVTGVPITVILYGDASGPRIVLSTTNSQHLTDVLGASAIPSPSAPTPSSSSDMYKALNLALTNQLTNRAYIVVYTSNADVPVDQDFLIRLAVRRAEVRVLSVSGTESTNSLTLSLVGNGIPIAVTGSEHFQSYLTNYVGPLFQSLQYRANIPQPVFNVYKTDKLTGDLSVNIPIDSTFDNAKINIFVYIYKGYIDGYDSIEKQAGDFTMYNIVGYNPKEVKTLPLKLFTSGKNGYYSIEIVGYFKTAYGFNRNNTNGSNEVLNSGVTYNVDNTMHIYSVPAADNLSPTNPGKFPYLALREINNNGSLSDSQTVLFTRKTGDDCFFQHFTTLDVCSQSSTIGYQVQLTTRLSETENRQQQFVLTCFKSTYADGNTTCKGHGPPATLPVDYCKCDNNFGGIDCTEPVCVNGGVRDMSVCRCPVDNYGLLCNNTFGQSPPVTTSAPATLAPTTLAPTTTYISSSTNVPSTSTTPLPSTITTTSPNVVRVVAFVIDCIGSDDFAFNQTIQSIGEYYKSFGNSHWVMLISNIDGDVLEFPFQQYQNESSIVNKTMLFWNDRYIASRNSSLTYALNKINKAFMDRKTQFEGALSSNIFYLTQISLKDSDDPTAALVGLEQFQKSSVVFSSFTKKADQAVLDSLKKFSANATAAQTYFDGLQAMVTDTMDNTGASLPTKPPTLSCVYGLQSNIKLAIDRSKCTDEISNRLNTFLINFRFPFNYIENDEDRCGTTNPLPYFYRERTALTALSYYQIYLTTANFCPSQYTSQINSPVMGTTDAPTFSTRLWNAIGRNINSYSCSCTRFADANTMKIILWLPRAPADITDEYVGFLKLNTTNAYHFVVPFYDITEDSKAQPNGGNYYLLPNAATATDLQKDVIDVLHNKLCETYGVDPTNVPPSFFESNIENRHNDYYY
ncbi:hypothetical protein GCK72_024322 [Caenorhabditis remanei]|uniref:EGF-like domain-containing protein n=1 Tax=Caenorhabditis remanei TaxID=31234 RepID=A0A6A5FYX6_CAERE|nr:hypothetical protein GCK72_024322 [Caenorhabditis remanei]KAF1747856.1 hypothetical protein GCK72_024322 [Caenorhabditis remanei]